ncbi:MAG: zinc ribbon domain-containing protein [Bacilli bacterium]|nr:zinc ribbon domain-containing protein [Bacilli bacterium]
MKCPKCGQEIIDNKIFCPNCGKQLNKETSLGLSPMKMFLIFVVIMLLLGVGTIYYIANIGLNKELEKIISEPTIDTKKEIKDFYGSYIIKDVIATDNSLENINDLKNSIIGFEIEISKDKFKAGLYQIAWVKIDKPTLDVLNNFLIHKQALNITSENDYGFKIKGLNVEENASNDEEEFEILSFDNKLYIYYSNTYYELEVNKLGYKSSNTYYKVNLLEEKYISNINLELKAFNNNIKTNIENNTYDIYIVGYEEIINGDIIHLIVKESFGGVNSEITTKTIVFAFNKNTGEKVNLKAYIEHINEDYDDIIDKYETNREKIFEESIMGIITKYETSPDLVYYAKDNKLYISCGTDSYGILFAEVNIGGE